MGIRFLCGLLTTLGFLAHSGFVRGQERPTSQLLEVTITNAMKSETELDVTINVNNVGKNVLFVSSGVFRPDGLTLPYAFLNDSSELCLAFQLEAPPVVGPYVERSGISLMELPASKSATIRTKLPIPIPALAPLTVANRIESDNWENLLKREERLDVRLTKSLRVVFVYFEKDAGFDRMLNDKECSMQISGREVVTSGINAGKATYSLQQFVVSAPFRF